MSEKPILFSAPMIRALLSGAKTQTRRVVKPQPDIVSRDGLVVGVHTKEDEQHGRLGKTLRCPYGQPGDRLWVREAYRLRRWALGTHGCDLDLAPPSKIADSTRRYEADLMASAMPTEAIEWGKYRPGMFMLQQWSRITLEITGVRVERLQDISAKDILAEGAVERPHVDQFGRNPVSRFDGKVYLDLRSLWAAGWQSINGAGSWAKNPWLWVLEFRRVSTSVGAVASEPVRQDGHGAALQQPTQEGS